MNISKKPIAKLWRLLTDNLNPVKVALVVLLVFIPLYPKFPFQTVEGSYVSIRIDDLVVFAALFVWFLYQLKSGFPVFKEKIFKLFLIYWAAGAISLVGAMFISHLIDPKIAALHFIRRIEYMSLFFVALDGFRFLKLNHFAKIISISSIGVFAYGMGQKYFHFPVVSTMNEEFSKGAILYLDEWTRIGSTFAGHYDLAVWLVIILALLPVLIKNSPKFTEKVFLTAIMIMDFYLLTLTASRVSFVAYLIAITSTLIFLKAKRWIPVVVILSVIFALQSSELNIRLASSFQTLPVFTQKYTNVIAGLIPKPKVTPEPAPTIEPEKSDLNEIKQAGESGSQAKTSPTQIIPKKVVIREVRTWPKPEEIEAAAARSSSIRFDVEWPRAQRAFLKNPLLGTGYSSIGLATDNDYLRALGETGIIGFLSLGLVIFHLLKTGMLSLSNKKSFLGAGLVGIIVGFLANATFIDVFEASKAAFYFWIVTGILYQSIKTTSSEKIHE